MTPETLRSLLAQEEGPTLEFKLEYVLAGPGGDRNRAEVAKDLLALLNAAGRRGEAAHLILGAGDELHADRSRRAKDSKGLYKGAVFLEILNARCTPPVRELKYEEIELEKVTYGIVTLMPSRHVHQLTQDLVTPKGPTWRRNSVLIRHGDQVGNASPEEIHEIEEEIRRREPDRRSASEVTIKPPLKPGGPLHRLRGLDAWGYKSAQGGFCVRKDSQAVKDPGLSFSSKLS